MSERQVKMHRAHERDVFREMPERAAAIRAERRRLAARRQRPRPAGKHKPVNYAKRDAARFGAVRRSKYAFANGQPLFDCFNKSE